MKIRDLGVLNGPVALFGGPYSNAEAFHALARNLLARHIPPARWICTGDVVGYCAGAAETVAAQRRSGAAAIAGNVERQLAAGAPDCGCGFAPGSTCEGLSAGWYAHADRATTRDARDWMEDLPDMLIFAHEGRRYAVIHGGLSDIARFLWPSSPEAEFTREITAIEAAAGPVDGVVAGHCGLAFARLVNGVHWINAGAIGLPPNDGRPETRFALLAADGVRFHRLSYDHAAQAAAMRAAGLVQGYERALESGLWPSEEILPVELRR